MAGQIDLWLITSVEALDEFTGTGLWRGNIALIDDIFNRWLQIRDLPDNQNVTFTATPDFWAEVYRLYDPGTPRSDDEGSGDESADSQQQDDSLLAALNDEERGRLDELLENPFGAPAAAAAANDSWNPTEGELDEIDRLVEQIGAGNFPLDHFYELSAAQLTEIRRFALLGVSHILRFRNLDDSPDIHQLFRIVFQKLIDQTFQDGQDGDRVGMEIRHPALDKPILVPFSTPERLTADKLLVWIEKIKQSKRGFALDEEMVVKFTRIRPPQGRGWRRDFRGDWQKWYDQQTTSKNGCLIAIKNADSLCAPRALVLDLARQQQDDSPEHMTCYNTMKQPDRGEGKRKSKGSAQRRAAVELMQHAGLGDFEGAVGIPELKLLEEALNRDASHPQVRIKVFSKNHCNAIVYSGVPEDAPITLCLYHWGEHYDVICRIPSFVNRSYYCQSCDVGYSNRCTHQCTKHCRGCWKLGLCPFEAWTECKECRRFFGSQQCLETHLQKSNGSSVCDQSKRCPKCSKTYQVQNLHREKDQKHVCGTRYCRQCKEFVRGEGHLCYIPKIQPRKAKKRSAGAAALDRPTALDGEAREGDELLEGEGEDDPDSLEALIREREIAEGESPVEDRPEGAPYSLIFFDFEATQQVEVGENRLGPIYQHIPNACVVHKVCDGCKNRSLLEACGHCGKERRLIFSGETAKQDFCKWLFSEANVGSIAFAHNSKGYDAHFLLQYLFENGIAPKVVPKGREVMALTACGIRVLDSLNFLPFPLSALPKAFNLKELKKGFFPYFFSPEEGMDYVGEWPDAYFYDPAHMKPAVRDEFYKWHREQQDKVFKFREELLSYCESDVDILKGACLAFRQQVIEIEGVDPFPVSLTIASACNHIFRRNYLKEKTIGVIPNGGYRNKTRYSIISLKWLCWVEHSEGRRIRHARNGGEVKICSFYLDGFDFETRTVYEFHGCAVHGCPRCFKNRDQKTPFGNLKMGEAYEATLAKAQFLRSLDYTLVEKWECDLMRELRQNPEMKTYFSSLNLIEPMKVRDGFMGGRTEALRLHWKAKPGEKGRLVDVCSLYPDICKNGEFPLGHPTPVVANFQRISATERPYRGMIHCRVLPPQNLFIPLLPFRSEGKLTFPLCATCANQRNKEVCDHADSERSLTGIWTTLELYKALELGYKLEKVFEVWHYNEWAKYDGKDLDTGLFTRYINSFLKLKVQASGWPSWVQTDEDRAQFIQQFEEREGIRLDPGKIEVNKAMRSLAKLCLNSFWGKFGQRDNQTQLKYFTDPAEFFKLVTDDTNIIESVFMVNPEMVSVTYSREEEFVDVLTMTNVVIAAYTTSQARLKLYSYLEPLQGRVLYMDTDSILYLMRLGDRFELPLGSFLGELTNELEDFGRDAYITEFVGAGPKNYAYRVFDPATGKDHFVTKVRGITLNSYTSQKVNFGVMRRHVRQFVKEEEEERMTLYERKIRRTAERQIVSRTETKSYRVVFDKRRVCPDFMTYPFGYRP